MFFPEAMRTTDAMIGLLGEHGEAEELFGLSAGEIDRNNLKNVSLTEFRALRGQLAGFLYQLHSLPCFFGIGEEKVKRWIGEAFYVGITFF